MVERGSTNAVAADDADSTAAASAGSGSGFDTRAFCNEYGCIDISVGAAYRFAWPEDPSRIAFWVHHIVDASRTAIAHLIGHVRCGQAMMMERRLQVSTFERTQRMVAI